MHIIHLILSDAHNTSYRPTFYVCVEDTVFLDNAQTLVYFFCFKNFLKIINSLEKKTGRRTQNNRIYRLPSNVRIIKTTNISAERLNIRRQTKEKKTVTSCLREQTCL